MKKGGISRRIMCDEFMDLALKFVDVAKSDLEVSKLLMKERKYAQAVFYAEQSAEKLSKAIILSTCLLEPPELKREIGHYIFRRGLPRFFDIVAKCHLLTIEYLNEKVRISKGIKLDSRIKKLMEQLTSEIKYLLDISEERIIREFLIWRYRLEVKIDMIECERNILIKNVNDPLWSVIDELTDNLYEYVQDVGKFLKCFDSMSYDDTIRELINILKNFTLKIKKLYRERPSKTIKKELKSLRKLINESTDKIVRAMYLSIILIFLSTYMIVLEGVTDKVRYPDNQINPVRDLDENKIVVKLTSKFIKHIEESQLIELTKAFIKGKISENTEASKIYDKIAQFLRIEKFKEIF